MENSSRYELYSKNIIKKIHSCIDEKTSEDILKREHSYKLLFPGNISVMKLKNDSYFEMLLSGNSICIIDSDKLYLCNSTIAYDYVSYSEYDMYFNYSIMNPNIIFSINDFNNMKVVYKKLRVLFNGF